ncbi:MAG: gliding motility-associated C-terminal domain-containing protein [Bacteroidia bacterium]
MHKKILYTLSAVLCFSVSRGQSADSYTFFKGDTLSGFDIQAAYQDALKDHCHGREVEAFIKQKENAFVAAKFNMPHLVRKAASKTVPTILNTACNNSDFEAGTFAGWTGGVGNNPSSTGPITITNPAIVSGPIDASETSCFYHTLVDAAAGNDPYSGLPMLDPGGGTYAVRLGGENVNWNTTTPCVSGDQSTGYSGAEMLQQTFRVTASNSLFTYSYHVIMDKINHSAGQQPYFRVEVLDSNGNITNPCQQYYVIADPSGATPPGFLNSAILDNNGDNVYYLPWTSNSLNLSGYIGHPVTVRFTAAGCVLGGHFCYAYIDASCGPIAIPPNNPHVCIGQNDTLTAPNSGGVGTYIWSTLPSGNAGIVGSTTNQTVVVNASGTYQVVITYPNGCSYTIDTTIRFHALATSVLPTAATCNGLSNGSATVSPSGGTGPYTYSWTPGVISGQGTPTATGLGAGTYTVNIVDNTGCSSSTLVNIVQPTPLAAPGNSTGVACNGGSNGSTGVLASGGTPGYTYSWNPGSATTAGISNLPAGVYTCTITDSHGCTKTVTDTVKQPAVLAATPGVANVQCNGGATGADSVIVTGGTSAYAYSWSPTGGTGSKATGLPAGTYTCLVTDAHGCTTSVTSTVSQAPPITYTTSSTPTPCAGSTGSATITAAGGTGTLTYSWAPTAGSTNSLTVVTAGIYTVTVTDANGCTKVVNIPVSNTGGPASVITQSNNVTCYGGTNGSAAAKGTGGTGTLTYSWSPNSFTGTTDTLATNLPAGTYMITVVDASGCQTTLTDTIHQPLKVTANNATTNVSCFAGTNGQIVLNAAGGTPGYSYTWSPSGGTSATANGLSAGNYTCIITDTRGCKDTAHVTITQPTLLTVSDTTLSSSCFGGANGSASVTPSGGTPTYIYTWSPSGGTTSNATGLTAGNYTCTITDNKGCVKIVPLTVNQPTAVTASNTPSNISCNGGANGSATAAPSGGTPGYSYIWSPTGGTAATASGLTAGTYTCTITDSHGCTLVSPVTITQPAVLAATSTHVNVTCNGLTNGSGTAIPTGGTAIYTYNWSPSGGTGATATGLGASNYTCSITDAHGCTTQTVLTVTQPVALTEVVNTASEKCFGGTTVSDTIHAAGGTGAYTYSWTPSGGNAAIATGLAAGNYTCTVTDANGCVKTQTVTITQPTAVTGTPSSTSAICLSHNGTASVLAGGGTGPYTYTWSPTTGSTNSISGLASGAYNCTVTDSKGCSVAVAVTVGHGSNPISANFTATPMTGYAPLPVNFLNGSSASAVSWAWNFGDGGVSTLQNPSNTYTSPGTYTVSETATDANGCDSTYDLVIIVKEPLSTLTVPNIFTPNNDGENDFFKVTYTSIETFDLKIYDRWGVLMAHFTHPWLGWDGLTFTGSKAVDGTYYYVITAGGSDGKAYNKAGWFALIR